MSTLLEKRGPAIISIISILVPIVVVVLMFLPERVNVFGMNDNYFPLFHAALNLTTAILLVLGIYLITNGYRQAHKFVMTTAFVISAIFLVSYVLSKYSFEPVPYPEDAPLRGIYLFILISHIVLSGIILPLVLTTMYFSWTEQFIKHRRIARWTFPIWLYVAISGVLVFCFMFPYY
jgi:putative membrane protein